MALFDFAPNGTPYGIYEGDDIRDALNTCARNAGYASLEASAAVLGKDVDDYVDEMTQWIEEVEDEGQADIIRKSKFSA